MEIVLLYQELPTSLAPQRGTIGLLCAVPGPSWGNQLTRGLAELTVVLATVTPYSEGIAGQNVCNHVQCSESPIPPETQDVLVSLAASVARVAIQRSSFTDSKPRLC